jgi:hypothetical protein
MAYNFLRGGHDQPFLLSPDLRDWLPEDQLLAGCFGPVHRLLRRRRRGLTTPTRVRPDASDFSTLTTWAGERRSC